MVIIQEAKISLQVKFQKLMKTIPSHIADAKGKTVLMGLRVLWSSSFIWSCKVLTIFTSHITKLVHRRSWWILSMMRTGWLSGKVGSS